MEIFQEPRFGGVFYDYRLECFFYVSCEIIKMARKDADNQSAANPGIGKLW